MPTRLCSGTSVGYDCSGWNTALDKCTGLLYCPYLLGPPRYLKDVDPQRWFFSNGWWIDDCGATESLRSFGVVKLGPGEDVALIPFPRTGTVVGDVTPPPPLPLHTHSYPCDG